LEEFWRNLDESGGIYERKTLFQMKKEADQARFKGTRTEPLYQKAHIQNKRV